MKQQDRKSIIAGLYGNSLEWYDFLLYASFAPIFADDFFPSQQEYLSLLATFGVFAIGFIMRPLGGLIIGHYADHHGRRKALILSVVIMTLSTAAIALLPNYRQIGAFAPLAFTLLRMVQGLAVGGELPGSTTFLIEHMLPHRRGFAGSLVLSTAFLGIFAGSLTASTLSLMLSQQQLADWGWRLAYLFGAGLGVIGIFLRLQSKESPLFEQGQKTTELPAKQVFSKHLPELFSAILFTSVLAMANYVLIAFMTTFLVKIKGFALSEVLSINLFSLFLLTLLIPIMGLCSDKYGRKPILMISLIGLFFLTFPIFVLLNSHQLPLIALSEILLCLLLAPLNAVVPTLLAELFPTNVRASGSSIGYNIGQAVFGGTLPLVALSLIELTGSNISPAWYLYLWTGLVLIKTLSMEETKSKELR